MRKYTLYQAAKYSKISRYKLEQAIKQGILKTQAGKGNIKYFILESELKGFLDEHGDQFIKHSFNSDVNGNLNGDIMNFISRELHEQMMREKERIIRLLEFQNEKYFPLIPNSDKIKLHLNQKYNQKLVKLQELFNKALTLIETDNKDVRDKIRDESDKIFDTELVQN